MRNNSTGNANSTKMHICINTINSKFLIIVGLCLLLLTAMSCKNKKQSDDSVDNAQSADQMKAQDSALGSSESDADFIVKAANGGMAEVKVGKLATQKATKSSVKDFASQMVKDHSEINDRLQKLADSLNVTIPATVDKDQQDNYGKLNATAVKDFDKAYMDLMVKAHDKDVDMFKKAAGEISSPGLHSFIIESLPILLHHQQMAKSLDDSLK